MSDSTAILRALLIYGICLPLAIFLGYSLATPDDRNTLTLVGLIVLALSLPFLLRWHHSILILSWNVGATLFFLPGRPQLWLVMVPLSLGIALAHFAINRNRKFLLTRSLTVPLLLILGVLLVTAWLNGGIGFNIFGDSTYGGKRYVLLLAAILGFFTLVSRQIPEAHARLYTMMFLASSAIPIAFQLVARINPSLNLYFPLFPSDEDMLRATTDTVFASSMNPISRLGGLATAGTAICFFLMANYGIRQLFVFRHPWRLFLMIIAIAISFLGGFRSMFIGLVATFVTVFYLEGLLRTRLTFWFSLILILIGIGVLPFTNKLPLAVQRSISFLPVQVDPIAAADAQTSTEWRLEIWKVLWPEVPKYLLIGKGYAINAEELELAKSLAQSGGSSADVAMLAGDYHSGPLSIIIPLGIGGAIAFLWLLAAAIHALYCNYAYSSPELKHINTFLFGYFLVRIFIYFGLFGSFYSDLAAFTGLIGFSISLNGGVCGPVATPQPELTHTKVRPVVPNPVKDLPSASRSP